MTTQQPVLFLHRKSPEIFFEPNNVLKTFDHLFVHKSGQDGFSMNPIQTTFNQLRPGISRCNEMFMPMHNEKLHSVTVTITEELRQAVGDKIKVFVQRAIRDPEDQSPQPRWIPQLDVIPMANLTQEALGDGVLAAVGFGLNTTSQLTPEERQLFTDHMLVLTQKPTERLHENLQYTVTHAGKVATRIILEEALKEGRAMDAHMIELYLKENGRVIELPDTPGKKEA